jgi:nucleotide-binding universal stress UspA family protein
MFKTILAAVDASRYGDRVTRQAAALAALSDARLVIVHVADPGLANDDLEMLAITEHLEAPASGDVHPGIARVPGWFDDAIRDVEGAASARSALEKLGTQVLERAAFLAAESGARSVSRILEDGDPASVLLAVAEREGADLIVLGSRGLGRIKEIQLGSVSHKVTMMARCACLIVK